MKSILIRLATAMAVASLAASCATLPGGGGDGQLAVGIDQESEVERADIFLDGKMICTVHKGEDRREFKMPAGYYRMRIVADGYEKWDRTIEVVGGNDYQEIHVRLQKILALLNRLLWDWAVV